MYRYLCLQTYVSREIADWIKARASDRKVSVSVAVRDILVDAWQAESRSEAQVSGQDPERQAIFVSVALDALLSGHGDTTLRQRTHDAYHRRLRRLGFTAAPIPGGDDEA